MRRAHLSISSSIALHPAARLVGAASDARYVERAEKSGWWLTRPASACPRPRGAALIPIKKSGGVVELTQEERRRIFEDKSQHIAASMKYLPAIAWGHHCRDLGEPFDFLTWFEYYPANAALFEELVAMLRATEESGILWSARSMRVEREPWMRVRFRGSAAGRPVTGQL